MVDFIFSPSSQPTLDCILENFNVRRLDAVRLSYIGAIAINASELFTNVDPLVTYISLNMNFYNNEGANRTLWFYNTAANLIFTSNTLATTVEIFFTNNYCLVFNYIAASVALANAVTSLNFVGYRMITQ
jgi:hypothetical protein